MDEKDFKKYSVIVAVFGLAILAFLTIKPLITPIILGLLSAYVFFPLFKKLKKNIKSNNICAGIVVVTLIIIVLVPLIILTPIFIKQLFSVYIEFRNTDLPVTIFKLVPQLNNFPELSTELRSAISHFSAEISTLMLSVFKSTILSIPALLMGALIMIFTFFFSLKEGSHVMSYFSTLFPFPEDIQKKFYEKFEHLTNSVVYGQLIIGIVQGIVAGVGYFMFGINNALLLTIVTIIVGIIPVIGPWFVWIPLDISLFLSGNTTQAIQLLIYGLAVINVIAAFLIPHIVASRAKMNPAIALIGAIGGTYAFGVIGLIVGPLLLACLILMIELFKNKKSEESIVLKEAEPKS